jgi:O-antigen/teichoic acid export membrane protein
MFNSERKTGIVLGQISIALRNALGLLLIPFIIHHVGVNNYGVYSLVSSLALYLVILEFGLSNTVVRYLSKYNAENNKAAESQFLGMMLSIYVVICCLVISAGLTLWYFMPALFSEGLTPLEITLLQQSFLILLVNIIITLMANSFTGVITAYEKFTFQMSSQIVLFLIRCSAVFFALVLGYGVLVIVAIDTVINALHTLLKLFYVFFRLKVRIHFIRPNIKLLKEVFIYTGFIAIGVIINQINWRLDNFILGVLTNSQTLGVFNIGLQLILSYIAFASAISNVFTPKLFKMVTLKANLTELTQELINIGRLQMMVLGFVLSAFIVFGALFIQLFVGDEFALAYWVALLPMLPFTFVLAQTSATSILQAMNKHKTRSLLLLATAVINIVISVLLVKNIGLLGASIGTCFSLVIGELLLVNIYLVRSIGIDMVSFYRIIIRSTVPGIIFTSCLGWLISPYISATWFGLILGCLMLFIIYFTFLYLFTFSAVEKDYIKGMRQTVISQLIKN